MTNENDEVWFYWPALSSLTKVVIGSSSSIAVMDLEAQVPFAAQVILSFFMSSLTLFICRSGSCQPHSTPDLPACPAPPGPQCPRARHLERRQPHQSRPGDRWATCAPGTEQALPASWVAVTVSLRQRTSCSGKSHDLRPQVNMAFPLSAMYHRKWIKAECIACLPTTFSCEWSKDCKIWSDWVCSWY